MLSQIDSHNFFMQHLSLYTSCLFSMLLINDIVDIQKLDSICSPTFVMDEFSGLFSVLIFKSITSLLNIQDLRK